MRSVFLICGLFLASAASAQPLAVNFRGSFSLSTTTTDQNGQGFTVAGLSGLTQLTATTFVAVMDNSNKLVFLTVALNNDGSIANATITGGLTLAESRDFEGIAYTTPARGSVFLAEEGTPQVREYRLSDGALLQALTTPTVFSNRRANFGFESLTRHPLGTELWTANEEALTVDGALSTTTTGTIVRLLRHTLAGDTAMPAQQYAYLTQPIHGGAISNNRSGVSDMVQLPNGRLLVLERSLASSIPNFFQSRLYEVSFAGATDVSAMPGLIGQSYTLATKTPLWTGSIQNLEGLTLGPILGPGRRSLLGIVDDGDPLSINLLVGLELVGPVEAADANCDGVVNNFDIDAFVLALIDPAAFALQYPGCDRRNADANGDGAINNFDIDAFVECVLAGGCS